MQERDTARPGARREAALALLDWQTGLREVPPSALADAALRSGLARLAEATPRQPDGTAWSPVQQRAWEQACQRLVASALAQPQIALREDEGEDEGEDGRDGAAPATRRGPLLHDLARLLLDPARFDPAQPQEEDQVIDAAVRWWQAARRTLPLGEALAQDFGECWRALEWMALLQQLQRIGELCQAGPSPELAPLLASATRIALRYGPLSPVLLRLAPLSGQAPASGFTF